MRIRAFLALMSVSMQVHGTSILEFDKWMQHIERHALSVQKRLAREDIEGSTEDARALIELYEQMQMYFENRGHAERAVEMSRDGRNAAAAIVTNLTSKNFDAAVTAARHLTRECRTCHRAFKPLD